MGSGPLIRALNKPEKGAVGVNQGADCSAPCLSLRAMGSRPASGLFRDTGGQHGFEEGPDIIEPQAAAEPAFSRIKAGVREELEG